MCKRCKEAFKSSSRGTQVLGTGGTLISRNTLYNLVSDMRVAGAPNTHANTPADVKQAFKTGFQDAQNVPAAVAMMECVASLSGSTHDSFPTFLPSSDDTKRAVYDSMKPSLDVMAKYCACFVHLLTVKACTVEEHLTNLSEMAHLLFVMYRKNKAAFVPAQNYNNTQSMIKGIFTSVLTAKAEGIDEYFVCLDSDDRLEVFFGVLRAMFSGRNFDAVQFADRASSAVVVQGILDAHPELDMGSRHLQTTKDHWNTASYLADEDRNPVRERVTLSNCDVARAWNAGATHIVEFLSALTLDGSQCFEPDEYDFRTLAGDVDMKRPLGEWVGVSHSDRTTDEDEISAENRRLRTSDVQDCCGADSGITQLPESSPDDLTSLSGQEGTADFEGELGITQDEQESMSIIPGAPQAKVSRWLDDETGTPVHIETIFKRVFGEATVEKSTDRLRRVIGARKAGSTSDTATSSDAASTSMIQGGADPLLCLISANSVVTVVLVMPETFMLTTGAKTNLIHPQELSQTKVSGQIMKLEVGTDDSKLVWGSRYCGLLSEASGFVCRPMKLDMEKATVDSQALVAALQELYSEVSAAEAHDKIWVMPKVPECIPYSPGLRAIEADGMTAVNFKDGVESDRVVCKICSLSWPKDRLYIHAAWHIAETPDSVPSRFPCGVCGDGTHSVYTADPNAVETCCAYVKSDKDKLVGKSMTKPKIFCKLIGLCDYKPVYRARRTAATPCTNHLIMCPQCPHNVGSVPVWHWKYRGMQSHWDDQHAGVTMPTDLKEQLQISASEADGVRKLGKGGRHTPKRATPTNVANAPVNDSSRDGDNAESDTDDGDSQASNLPLLVIDGYSLMDCL